MDSQLQEPVGAERATVADDVDARRQTLRQQRHRMAAGTSVLVAGIVYAAHLQGALSAAAALSSAGAILACILVFYALFRSGLNRRFADPSLTLPQMIAATLVLLGTMYASHTGHSIFLLFLLMVFMFGILHFDTRQLIVQATAILAAYATLIGLMWFTRPGIELGLEVLRWLTLAIALFWFAWMGGYIRNLRNQVRRRNEELTAALRATQASESNLAEAQRIARIGMWMVDPATRRTTWSAETFRLFEVDPANGVPRGATLHELIHPDDLQRYIDLIRPALLEGRAFDSEFRLRLAGGRVRWLHALGSPVLDEEDRIVMVRGTLRDITEQREADEHIRRLAHFDSLTGLPNRSLFSQLLARSIAQAQRRRRPLAVLFIDLDGFKQVNDHLGHDAGDALLAAFASRLTASLRRSDAAGRGHAADAAARLGGDEFVVLIDDFSEASQLEVIASRIVSIASSPFRLRGALTGTAAAGDLGTEGSTGRRSHDDIDGGVEVAVGASIGIAIYPEDGDSLDSVMRRADEAMYRAKQAGKNTWRFCAPGAA